ncbi:MAG TPA: heme lyase CcmF/NrfE family subunit [Gammaproteobacteria bacterium]|nr:heme lyase CcmF/NrfE family subunit [Gammaproteobacteria bacterium]
MIPEIGHLLLIGALVLTFIGGSLPFYDLVLKKSFSQNYIRPLSILISILVAGSFTCLIYSFLVDDFSVIYVATNSNTALPSYYKFAAAWGAHEGSLVLWILCLSLWLLGYLFSKDSVNDHFSSITFAVMNQVIFAFILFTLFTSNPFERLLPFSPVQGGDLNPSLQDFAFTIHPPLLYLGYSGLALPFSLAIAAMVTKNIDSLWARTARPWSLLSCTFLTLGIGLGSWWAYYELGWGGWWFWDPVENAAFVPWLISIALFHSLIATEKRGVFKNWSLLLSILSFAASLLGTFLVRSGVLTSVHAFALDPERGLFILWIFSYFIFGALFIYIFNNTKTQVESTYSLRSIEFGFLLNNLLLVVLAISIMFGTIFPLLYEAYTNGKQVSVGPPYFNFLILPFAIGLGLLQGIGLFLGWSDTKDFKFFPRIIIEALTILIVINILLYFLFGSFNTGSLIACFIFAWIVSGNLLDVFIKKRTFNKIKSFLNFRLGAVFAHLGIAFLVLGVGVVSTYSSEKELILSVGDSYDLDSYVFEFEEMTFKQGPNYIADVANLKIKEDGRLIKLSSEKRNYLSTNQVTTEAGIVADLFKDYYVAVGENIQGDTWSFRLQVKPFVRWIWFGALLVAIGTLISSIKHLRKGI